MHHDLELGARERAMLHLRQAVILEPSRAEARAFLAELLEEVSPGDAVTEHRRLLAADPLRATSWAALYRHFERTRAHEKIVLACLLHDIATAGFIRGDHGYWSAQLVEPYVDEEVSWAIRYHQARYLLAAPVGTKAKVTFVNPGGQPNTATLRAVAERNSFSRTAPRTKRSRRR